MLKGRGCQILYCSPIKNGGIVDEDVYALKLILHLFVEQPSTILVTDVGATNGNPLVTKFAQVRLRSRESGLI